MLRKESHAGFQKSGWWIFSRFRFTAGRLSAASDLSLASYKRLLAAQTEQAVLLLEDEQARRRWWLFRDVVYSEAEGLDAADVRALALQSEGRKARRLERARQIAGGATDRPPPRESIPDDVRLFVWNRDGGRCVRCGSRERLEFDHIIPVAAGGSSTARNLQILCEECNRAKGASIA